MSSTGGQPIRVLHVEDEPAFADVVATYFERNHDCITVETVTSAREGLDHLAGASVDCIVSDHEMPGMNGVEFLRVVREEYPDLPFVMYTGKGNEEVASDAISAGVTEYLQKATGTDQYAVLANRIERAVEEYRATSALEESERMLSTLMGNLPGMAYRCRNEVGWPMEFVSDGCPDLTGYEPTELVEGDVDWGEDILVESERERLWESVQAALDEREPFEVTYRIRTADGRLKWAWEWGRGVFEDGDLVALEGIILDATERREREAELEQYRMLVENVGDAMYVLGPEGTIRMANRAMADYLGCDREEIVGSHASRFMPEEDVETGERVIQRLLTTGETWGTFEMEMIHADGTRSINEDKVAVLTDEDGSLLGSVGVIREITERIERERELGRYESIIEAVGDPVFALDETGIITFVNDAASDLSEYEPADLIGDHARELLSDEDWRRSVEAVQELRENEEMSYVTVEVEIVDADGSAIPAENHLALLSAEDGEGGVAGVIRDITERKLREKRLEEFASVVSHDLQAPLNLIDGRAELALETGDLDHVAEIVDAADRMDDLIEDILALAQKGQTVGELEPSSLERVANDAWAGIEAGRASLRVEGDLTLEADPDRLRDLLSNLFRNAVEHGSTGSDSPARQVESESTPSVSVTVGPLADGRGFYLADDGPGIPEDRREQVFEYGHTTDPDGTGLGLAIVENIIQAHGWSISITDAADGGARFEIVTG